jgi:hypothetical protein
MPIVIRDLSGLGKGISTAGDALASALKVKTERELSEKRGTILGDILSRMGDDPTVGTLSQAMGEAQSKGISTDEITKTFTPFIPIVKEKEKRAGSQSYLDNILYPNGKPGNAASLTVGSKPLEAKEDVIKETVEETDSIDAVSAPSLEEEVPREPGMNPVKPTPLFEDETGKQKSIKVIEGTDVNEDQINQMIASPHENHRRLGEALQKKALAEDKMEYKEKAEIRKEHRARIRKFSEPYDDIGKLQSNVNRLNQVTDLIENDSASFDDSFWRTTASALLEDRGDITVAELFKTPAQQKMYSLLRPFFGSKELGGSNPSTREVLLSLSTLPSNLKGKDANLYIARMLKDEAKVALETGKEVNKLNEKSMPWSEFQSKLQNKVSPLREENAQELLMMNKMQMAKEFIKYKKPKKGHTFMMSPSGDVKEVANEDVNRALKSGRLINDGK